MRPRPICVYASEAAALVGESRYKTVAETQVQIWERANPAQLQRSKALLSAAAGRVVASVQERAAAAVGALERKRVKSAVSVVAASTDVAKSVKRVLAQDSLLASMPPAQKQARVEAAERETAVATSAAVDDAVGELPAHRRAEATSILLNHAPAEATALLSSVSSEAPRLVGAVDAARRAAAQRAVSRALPSVDEAVETAVNGATATAGALDALTTQPSVRALLRGRIHTTRGTRRETQGLDRLEADRGEAVTDRNAKGFSKRYSMVGGTAFTLYGKIDGVQGDEVVEHKDRQNRLFGRLIRRERIQLLVYLALTNRTKGVLVETYGKEQRRYPLVFNTDEWEPLLERIKAAVAALHTILKGDDEAPRAALLRQVLA